MKNFYEAMDIDCSRAIKVTAGWKHIVAPNQTFRVRAHLNDRLIFDDFAKDALFQAELPLLENIKVRIELSGKDPNRIEPGTDLALLVFLSINGFSVLPEHQELSFYMSDSEEVISPTHYLGYNGVWTFDIDEPFYRWLHKTQPWGFTL